MPEPCEKPSQTPLENGAMILRAKNKHPGDLVRLMNVNDTMPFYKDQR